MKFKEIEIIEYSYGDEARIQRILNKSKVPLLIKIKDFPEKFTIEYFEQQRKIMTHYSTYANAQCVAHQAGDLNFVLSEIKQNKPYRIFGQFFSQDFSWEIERYVPLWQKIPLRPRYFRKNIKTTYFFGGEGTHTDIHFDREQCSNLHLCLSGTKELLLFTENQSDYLYKMPYIGDSMIDFGQPLEDIYKQYPRIKQAEAYRVLIKTGDMLFMPRNCWHFTKYLTPSAAASYIFYPHKFLQFYGFFTGHFFLGYKESTGFRMAEWPYFQKFSTCYALATGTTKFCLKIIEKISYVVLLPVVSISNFFAHLVRPRRVF